MPAAATYTEALDNHPHAYLSAMSRTCLRACRSRSTAPRATARRTPDPPTPASLPINLGHVAAWTPMHLDTPRRAARTGTGDRSIVSTRAQRHATARDSAVTVARRATRKAGRGKARGAFRRGMCPGSRLVGWVGHEPVRSGGPVGRRVCGCVTATIRGKSVGLCRDLRGDKASAATCGVVLCTGRANLPDECRACIAVVATGARRRR